MNQVSYILNNVVCLILLYGMAKVTRQKHGAFSLLNLAFLRLIDATAVICLMDSAAYLLRGSTFPGARVLLHISNMLYFGMLTFDGFVWLIYANLRINGYNISRKKNMLLWGIPLFAFCAVLISNPWTHLLFSFDENNLYQRGSLLFIHWAFSWFYLLLPTFQALNAIRKAENKLKKHEMYPLFTFAVMPALGTVAQMLFYGLNTIQLGITLSMITVMVGNLVNQASHDELTGLNNRHDLVRYINEQAPRKKTLTVFMVDIDDFKHINDTCGHLAGDEALRCVANALKRSCAIHFAHPFLCRYGGDEFVFVGADMDEKAAMSFRNVMEDEVEKENSADKPYRLSLSIGWDTGVCDSWTTMEKLLANADNSMYRRKNRR